MIFWTDLSVTLLFSLCFSGFAPNNTSLGPKRSGPIQGHFFTPTISQDTTGKQCPSCEYILKMSKLSIMRLPAQRCHLHRSSGSSQSELTDCKECKYFCHRYKVCTTNYWKRNQEHSYKTVTSYQSDCTMQPMQCVVLSKLLCT